MKKRICQIAALGSALILAFSAPVQAAAVTANGTPAAVATNNIQSWPAGPQTTSEAAVLIDADTGAVLYDKGMNECRYPASTTKLMTLLVAIENSSPKDIVTFTETGIRDVTWDSSNINAQLGEQMTMKDCWFAAYIKSANEVCAQIAEYVGGTEANFVDMMNQKAKELGCTHTHFVNANGLHSEDHYTTVYDLYLMFNAAMQHEEFLQMLQEKEYQASYQAADGTTVEAVWSTTNQFTKGDVTVPDGVTAVGGKTGTTTAAMSCLVQLFEDAQGEQYVAIILGCKERGILYQEMQTFLSNLNN